MAQAATVIAAGTTVSGRIEGSEDVTVLGAVKGTIELEGALLVDGAARVEADCAVTDLEVHGILVGNVSATERIELHKTARVIGDIAAPRVIVHEGAKFRGLLDMGAAAESEGRDTKRTRGRTSSPSRARPAPRRAKAASEAPPPAEPAPTPEAKPATKKKVVKKAAQ